MGKQNEIIDLLKSHHHLTKEDIPDIDLYMDQIIQLFEKKYGETKRNEKEKVLTKTMINNYAKGKLFYPITNKKYSKNHVLLISLIYQLKGVLSIQDIKQVLDKLNNKVVEQKFDLVSFYDSYVQLSERNRESVIEQVKESSREVEKEVNRLRDEEEDYLEQVLMIASFVNMSNYYRRAAEKLIDSMDAKNDES